MSDNAPPPLPFPAPVPPSRHATQPGLELASITKLPLGDQEYSNLKFIIPVDPMGWTDLYNPGTRSETQAQLDALLSVSNDGELAFWAAEVQSSPSSSRSDSPAKVKEEVNLTTKPNQSFWKCTGTVRTGRKDIRIAACSSAKKSVLGIYE